MKEGNIGIGSVSFDVITGGWKWKYGSLSLLDFGHAEASAQLKDGSVELGAFASIWSPSGSVTFFGITIGISAEVGAVGADLNLGNGKVKAKAAWGWGASLEISW